MPCCVCGHKEKICDERTLYICGRCTLIIPGWDKIKKCRMILDKYNQNKEVGKFLSKIFLGFIPTEEYIDSLMGGGFRRTKRIESNNDDPKEDCPARRKRLVVPNIPENIVIVRRTNRL